MSRACFGSACMLCPDSSRWSRLKRNESSLRYTASASSGSSSILPGVVGPNLPAGFATFAAYGDFATGVLAILALLTVRVRPLFWFFVVAFNLVGTVDLLLAYYHAIRVGLARAGGATRRCLRHPDPLCASADDHALRRSLLAGASAAQGGSCAIGSMRPHPDRSLGPFSRNLIS